MPEGPDLNLASVYVNTQCAGLIFTGAVEKSEVSKGAVVPFSCDAYRISASSRGKEVRLTLTPVKSDTKSKGKSGQNQEPMDVIFRFGMSGIFRFTKSSELPKHAHLRFYTKEVPQRVLSFVDTRRFGSWHPNTSWQPTRGPCAMFEYKSFRDNVLSNLSDSAFDRPICEALLNQKYFNGIGNYLRAEILYRSNIPPFMKARTVLEGLGTKNNETQDDKEEITVAETSDADMKKKNTERPDLLSLCHTVPLEVVNLGKKGYDPEKAYYVDFQSWVQCYNVDGMRSLKDRDGRTIWFKHCSQRLSRIVACFLPGGTVLPGIMERIHMCTTCNWSPTRLSSGMTSPSSPVSSMKFFWPLLSFCFVFLKTYPLSRLVKLLHRSLR